MHRRLVSIIGVAAIVLAASSAALIDTRAPAAAQGPAVGGPPYVALELEAGTQFVGWFGGPTTSTALLAATFGLDRIWWLNPSTGFWMVDDPTLPPFIRRTITIQRGTGFLATTSYSTFLLVPIADFLASNGCPENPSPADPADPSIIVSAPATGATVTSPVHIAGQARVFEATVSIAIIGAVDGVLADTFTTAAEGAPTLAAFATDVSIAPTRAQNGCLLVFESSARDGSSVNIVQVPVRIAP